MHYVLYIQLSWLCNTQRERCYAITLYASVQHLGASETERQAGGEPTYELIKATVERDENSV